MKNPKREEPMEAPNEAADDQYIEVNVTFHATAAKPADMPMRILAQGEVYGFPDDRDVRFVVGDLPCCSDHIIVGVAEMSTDEAGNEAVISDYGLVLRFSPIVMAVLLRAYPDIDLAASRGKIA